MTSRAWLLLRTGVAGVAFVAGAIVAALGLSALIVYVPYAAVGAVLIIRRPEHPIGWLLGAIGWVFALAWLPINAAPVELETLSAPPILLAAAWFKWWWSLPLSFTLIAVVAITFPAGRIPAGRWRLPALLLIGVMLASTLAAAVWPVVEVFPDSASQVAVQMPNPLRLLPGGLPVPGTGVLSSAAGPLMFVLLMISIGSLIVRYRRSAGTERLQLRWLVTGLASVLAAIPLGFVLYAVFGAWIQGLAWLPAIIAFTLPPIAIGFAVTSYRLYEIDRIISRTLGWAGITVVLAGIYLAGLLILQAALGGFTQGNTLAVAGSTLLAAAAFQPLRQRIQVTLDHRFDRARYDGERIATAFAERLRDQINLDGLRADIGATVAVALRPSASGLWIRPTGPAGK